MTFKAALCLRSSSISSVKGLAAKHICDENHSMTQTPEAQTHAIPRQQVFESLSHVSSMFDTHVQSE